MDNFYFNITDKTRIVLFGLILISLGACKSIIEEDISGENVVVIIPQNNIVLNNNNVHFKWEELEGADEYNLQLVEPSFSAIQTFILDTNIADLEFYQILDPGEYQYRIKALNGAYETAYTGPYTFTVDSVSDLSGQLVPLVSPDDMTYTTSSDFTAVWQSIYAADYYEFQIRTGSDFNTGTILLTETNIYGLTYATSSGPLYQDDYFSWGVKAYNQNSQSSYSTHVIARDTELPNDVTLTGPYDSYTASADTVTLYWNYGTDPGNVNSPITYYVHIGTDAGFSNFDVYSAVVDSLNTPSLSSGTYYWRVFAEDDAGNQSFDYSDTLSFSIP